MARGKRDAEEDHVGMVKLDEVSGTPWSHEGPRDEFNTVRYLTVKSMKERLELHLEPETIKLLRTAAIKKYGNLRAVSRLIEDLAVAMCPECGDIHIREIETKKRLRPRQCLTKH